MGILQTARFIVRHPIAGRHPLASLRDRVQWQVASRLAPGALVVPFVGRARLLVRSGMQGATGNIYVGLHELEEMAFALHFLRPTDVFADIGANVGSYSMIAGAAVGARVHAFEPVPATFAALRDNVQLNGLGGRATLHPIGVGERQATLAMTATADCENRLLDPGETVAGSIEVEVRRLDDVLANDVPTLAKIDVEGHELGVLHGGPRTLGAPACRALIIEVTRDFDAVLAAARALGFTPVDYAPLTRMLTPIQGLHPKRGNTIFVRDVAEAAERVQTAPRFALKRTDI